MKRTRKLSLSKTTSGKTRSEKEDPSRSMSSVMSDADDAILIQDDDPILIPDTQPIDQKILKDVIAFVEVRTKNDNRSQGVSKQLELLGATVSKKFSNDVTHVIWKDGKKSTVDKAVKKGIFVVSVLWIESCKQNQEHVAESLFPVAAPDDKDILQIGRLKRMKSMQPKPVEEDLQRSLDRGVRKRRRRDPLVSPAPLTLSPKVLVTDTQPMTPTICRGPATPSLIPDTPTHMKVCLDLLDSIKKKSGSAQRRLSAVDSPRISPATPLQQRLFQCFTDEAESLVVTPSTSARLAKSGPCKRTNSRKRLDGSSDESTSDDGMMTAKKSGGRASTETPNSRPGTDDEGKGCNSRRRLEGSSDDSAIEDHGISRGQEKGSKTTVENGVNIGDKPILGQALSKSPKVEAQTAAAAATTTSTEQIPTKKGRGGRRKSTPMAHSISVDTGEVASRNSEESIKDFKTDEKQPTKKGRGQQNKRLSRTKSDSHDTKETLEKQGENCLKETIQQANDTGNKKEIKESPRVEVEMNKRARRRSTKPAPVMTSSTEKGTAFSDIEESSSSYDPVPKDSGKLGEMNKSKRRRSSKPTPAMTSSKEQCTMSEDKEGNIDSVNALMSESGKIGVEMSKRGRRRSTRPSQLSLASHESGVVSNTSSASLNKTENDNTTKEDKFSVHGQKRSSRSIGTASGSLKEQTISADTDAETPSNDDKNKNRSERGTKSNAYSVQLKDVNKAEDMPLEDVASGPSSGTDAAAGHLSKKKRKLLPSNGPKLVDEPINAEPKENSSCEASERHVPKTLKSCLKQPSQKQSKSSGSKDQSKEDNCTPPTGPSSLISYVDIPAILATSKQQNRSSIEDFKLSGESQNNSKSSLTSSLKAKKRKKELSATGSEDENTSTQSATSAEGGKENESSSLDDKPKKKRKKVTLRDTPKERNPTLVMTSLHRGDQEIVMSVVNELGGFQITDTVCDSTTHIVIGEIRRTLNVLSGIARGCWLLSMDWVYKSVEAGEWLPEEAYEMSDNFPGALISRMSRKQIPGSRSEATSLFSSAGALYIPAESVPPRQRLVELVELCGGEVSKRVTEAKLCVGNSSRRKNGSIPVVQEKWILDSITRFKQLPWKEYLVETQ